MQVICHHNAAEAAFAQWPRAAFDISLDHLRIREVAHAGDIAVERRHRMTARAEQTCMPSRAAGEVEHRSASQNQRREADNPRFRCGKRMVHALATDLVLLELCPKYPAL